jgi:hypothetical protein
MYNSILSRNFKLNSLLLNGKGLHLLVGRNLRQQVDYELLITKDAAKICGLLGLDFDAVNAADDNIFMDLLYDNEYIKIHRFTEDASKGESKMLGLFAEYLKGKDVSRVYRHITHEMVLEYFWDEIPFIERYHKAQRAMSVRYGDLKISGQTILKFKPDYNTRYLSDTIPFFNKEMFLNDLERDYFIASNSEKDVVDYFLKTTDYLIGFSGVHTI